VKLIDLTHTISRKPDAQETPHVVVRSRQAIDRVKLERLVTLASVVDLTRRVDQAEVSRADVSRFGLAGIGGCILRTDWCDKMLAGCGEPPPRLDVGAAAYLLENGVSTVAADFPVRSAAADLLLHNNCVLVECVSGVADLTAEIVRLIALPLKFEGVFSAEARVIALEE